MSRPIGLLLSQAKTSLQTSLKAAIILLETAPRNLPTNFARVVRKTTFVPSSSPPKKSNAKRFSSTVFSWQSAAIVLPALSLHTAYIPSLRERIRAVPSSPRDPPISSCL